MRVAPTSRGHSFGRWLVVLLSTAPSAVMAAHDMMPPSPSPSCPPGFTAPFALASPIWSIQSGASACQLSCGGWCVTDGPGSYANLQSCTVAAMQDLEMTAVTFSLAGTTDAITIDRTPPPTVSSPITCGGGMYASEVGWTLTCDGVFVASGGAPFSGGPFTASGSCVLSMTDSFGDGWNNNIWNGFGTTITMTTGSGPTPTTFSIGGQPPPPLPPLL